LSALRSKPVEDVAETELEMVTAAVNAAKKTIISQAMLRSC